MYVWVVRKNCRSSPLSREGRVVLAAYQFEECSDRCRYSGILVKHVTGSKLPRVSVQLMVHYTHCKIYSVGMQLQIRKLLLMTESCQTRRYWVLLSRSDAETEKRDRVCRCFLECVASSPLENVCACEGVLWGLTRPDTADPPSRARIVNFAIKFLARSGNSMLQHSRWKAVVKQPPKNKPKLWKKKRVFVVWC